MSSQSERPPPLRFVERTWSGMVSGIVGQISPREESLENAAPSLRKITKNKQLELRTKQFETEAIVSALMLTVACSGLFANSALADFGPWKDISLVAYCVSTFAFMSTTIMTSCFVADVMVLDYAAVRKLLQGLWYAPRMLFGVGYICIVIGTTAFFLCSVSSWATLGCLAFCSSFAIVPTFIVIWRTLMIQFNRRAAEAQTIVEGESKADLF